MRILCQSEREIRDENIISMAAEDIIQQRQLQERMRVELLIKCKDRLSACIDDIINKLKVERGVFKELQDILQRSLDGVQGMAEDASKLADRMRGTLTRPPFMGNESLLGAVESQEACADCLREWSSQAQIWHQRGLKKLEPLIEDRSKAIEEYLDRRVAIDDWDFEMTSTTEAMMLLASAMDNLELDTSVFCAVLPAQLVDPFPVVGFCKKGPVPFGTTEANVQITEAFQKVKEWQIDTTRTFCGTLDAVTANILRDTTKLMATVL